MFKVTGVMFFNQGGKPWNSSFVPAGKDIFPFLKQRPSFVVVIVVWR